jgi:hypothetical protein
MSTTCPAGDHEYESEFILYFSPVAVNISRYEIYRP